MAMTGESAARAVRGTRSAEVILEDAARIAAGAGRKEISSRMIAAAAAAYHGEVPSPSAAWLRARVRAPTAAGLNEVARLFAFEAAPASSAPTLPFSSGGQLVIDLATSAAHAAGVDVAPRHLIGALLFARKRDGAPLARQTLDRFDLRVEDLRFEFLELMNRDDEGRLDTPFWRQVLAAESATPAPVAQAGPFHVRTTSLSDVPTDTDKLGLNPYVSAMAEFLLSPDTTPPLTVSIEGEWGSGKSSFLKQLEKKVTETRPDGTPGKRVVRFNPWRHDKDETVWAAFAEEFYEQALPRGFVDRQRARWRVLMKRVDWTAVGWQLARLAAWAAVFLSAYASVLVVAGRVQPASAWREAVQHWASVLVSLAGAAWASGTTQKAKQLFNPFQIDWKKFVQTVDYESKRTFLARFQADFEKVHEAIVGDDRIFVFVDDLDRCEVPRAAELLQAMNLMLPERSKLITVLAIDREKVAAAVAIRNDKLLPLVAPPPEGSKAAYDAQKAIEFGHWYLDKFIQIPFRMPRPNPQDVTTFVEHLLERSSLRPAAKDAATSAPPQAIATQAARPSRNPLPTLLAGAEGPVVKRMLPPPPDVAQERARAAAEIVRAESPEVRAVLAMVAPALDHNPRRLLQFINLFRLQAHVAGAQGLFESRLIGVQQLGKLTALALRWPQILGEIAARPELLGELQHAALSDLTGSRAHALIAAAPPLKTLLTHGLEGVDRAALDGHPLSLAGLDVSALLQTWSRPKASPDQPPAAQNARA